MKAKLSIVSLLLLCSSAMAHDDPEANHSGGPCWIWEVPLEPVYCLFTKGTRHEHPNPVPHT